MQNPEKSPWLLAAVLIVLAGLVAALVLSANRQQERDDTLTQNIGTLKTALGAIQAAQKDAPPVGDQVKALQGAQEALASKIDDQKSEIKQLRDDLKRQTDTLAALQQDVILKEASRMLPTPAQRTAAEQFYQKYLYPQSTKEISRQIPAGTVKDAVQGFKMNKWLAFKGEGTSATLVGMGQPYLNIKPDEMNNDNYGFYNQGILGTLLVVNFDTTDDTVFAQCRKSLEKNFDAAKLLTVFGHGAAEQIMHDGLNDEVILNVGQLTNCSLSGNP